MKNKYLILCTFFTLILTLLIWQQEDILAQNHKLAKKTQTWHTFKQENTSINLDFFLAHTPKQLLKLNENDELKVLKKQKDNINCEHVFLQQYYQDVLVEFAILKVHECEKQDLKANGGLATNLTLDTQATISEEVALNKALQTMAAQKYAWENERAEQFLQQTKNDNQATFYPKAQLVILSEQLFWQLEKTHLAYKFAIYAEKPLQHKTVYIDAHTGEFLFDINRLHQHEITINGTAQYACEDSIAFTADYNESNGEYCLKNNSTVIYDAQNTANFEDTYICSHNETFADSAAVAVLWASEQSLAYFSEAHNHENIGESEQILAHWLHYDEGYNNAFWNGNWFVYGDGDGTNYDAFVSLDIVAHEMTHALIDNTSNLIYAYEAGALNEGFCDIFAILIKHFAEPTCANWIIGDDIVKQTGKNGLRNLANPKDETMINRQPNTYKGEFWHYDATDNGGVHTNSGVLAFWFYLLVEGGSGTNDLQNAFVVESIGWEDAAAIIYHTLTNYLTPTSQYIDARNASIEATIDLFGEDSEQLNQLLNAWAAVGLAADLDSDKSLILTAFNNNDLITSGSLVDITWLSTGLVSHINLELSTDNGNIWYTIAENLVNDGLFVWQVPNLATNLVRLRITDSNDNNIFDLNDMSFQIENCPVISSFFSDNNKICQGESINFTNNAANAHIFRWYINNLEMTQTPDFSHEFQESGVYEIKLKATDTTKNCTNVYIEFVEIEENITADFAYTIDGLQIDAFINSDTSNLTSYQWLFNNSFFEVIPSFTHIVENAGTYELCLNVQSTCNASSFCQNISILTPAICEGDEVWHHYVSGMQINDITESQEDFWIASDGGLSVLHKIDGSVNTYTSFNSGLTDNKVTAIKVAPNKSKWIGTKNGGLLQFKNGAWHDYNTANSNLPSQKIYDIEIDANGAKWVATENGLLRINGGIWRVFDASNSSLPSNVIKCLEIKANGDMWIATDNGLLFYDKENNNAIVYNTQNSDLQSNNIQTLAIDNNNTIWLAYENGGLDSMLENIVTNHNDNLFNEYIQSIVVDSENEKWFGTKNGLLHFDNTTWNIFNSENSVFENNNIQALLLANNGQKWLGTAAGVYKNVEEAWEFVSTTTNVLPQNEITDIAIDEYQNIWATSIAGLVRYENDEWTVYNQSSFANLESQEFTSIAIDANNAKWIGSSDAGLFRFENGIWDNFSDENSNLANNHIFQIATDENDIWLTQNDKLIHFDGSNFIDFNFETNVEPTALSLDIANNQVWIGTKNHGIMLCETNNINSCNIINNSLLTDNQVNSLLIHDSNLFAATQNGMFNYENGSWNNFDSTNDSLNNDVINILTSDGQERLIAISNTTIYVFKNGNWKTYEIPQNLATPKKMATAIDANLNVWLATTEGIYTQIRSDEAHAFFEASSSTACENYTISFINKSVGANSYEWFINGISISENTDLIHEFTQAGNYTISLIATNENSCEDVFSQEISIYSLANNVNLPTQIAVCIEDENPVIEASAKDMFSYEWRRNELLISNSYFCEAIQQGIYELEITDNCGNTKSLETHIYIDNDCVWPGDLNRDEIVNHYDLLSLALAFGQYGQQRPEASTDWQGQPSFDWGVIVANSNDLKHIDANGNGIIDLSDIQMIDFHYGKTHNNQTINIPPDLSSDIDFRAILFSPPTATNNKTIEVDLEVTHKQDATIQAYGIAFDIEYALPAGLNMENIELDFSDSWLNTDGNDVQTIYKHFPEMNKIEVAITRTDHQNANSSGIMAKLRAEVDVVPSGTTALMVLNINNIMFINNGGLQIPIATSQNTLNILPEENGKTNLTTTFENVKIYPNPANDKVTLNLPNIALAKQTNLTAKLYNMQGKEFEPTITAQNKNKLQFNISDIPKGLYQFVLFNENEQLHTAKLMIYH